MWKLIVLCVWVPYYSRSQKPMDVFYMLFPCSYHYPCIWNCDCLWMFSVRLKVDLEWIDECDYAWRIFANSRNSPHKMVPSLRILTFKVINIKVILLEITFFVGRAVVDFAQLPTSRPMKLFYPLSVKVAKFISCKYAVVITQQTHTESQFK